MEAFEYAISKDIRNNQIVREIDHSRQRELWRWTGIGTVIVALLVFSAWQHFELLRHGYRSSRWSARASRKWRSTAISSCRSRRSSRRSASRRSPRSQLHMVEPDRRRGHRPRARDPRRPTCQVRRGQPVTRRRPVSEHAPDSWRRTIRRRLAVVVAAVRVLVRLPSRRASSTCRCTSTTRTSRVPSGSTSARSTSPPSAARFSIATTVCSRSASTRTSIYAVPSEIRDAGQARRRALRRPRGLRREVPRQRCASGSAGRGAFVWVKRQVSPGRGAEGCGARARGRRLHQGEPPVLPEHVARRARDRLRRPRQRGPRRHRSGVTTRSSAGGRARH